MSEKKQNLNFVTPNKDQQKLFENLSGKTDKVLLFYSNELTEDGVDFLEYYFTYSDVTAEKFGLETFYAKVKKYDKKKELISKAVSRLTEKMVKRNVVEIEEEPEFDLQSVGNANDSESAEDHLTYSQEHYRLRYKTKGHASFAALCKRKDVDEYYILTAQHCFKDNDIPKLQHCKNSLELEIDLELNDFANDINEDLLKNKLDAGIYKVKNYTSLESFPKTFIDSLYSVSEQFEIPEYTNKRYSYHGINSQLKYVNLNNICSKTDSKKLDPNLNDNHGNYFICSIDEQDKNVNIGESGGLVCNGKKLTGVLSGHTKDNSNMAIIANGAGKSSCAKNIQDVFNNKLILI